MENTNIRFWLLLIGLVTMMAISQSCAKSTSAHCQAYGHVPVYHGEYVAAHVHK